MEGTYSNFGGSNCGTHCCWTHRTCRVLRFSCEVDCSSHLDSLLRCRGPSSDSNPRVSVLFSDSSWTIGSRAFPLGSVFDRPPFWSEPPQAAAQGCMGPYFGWESSTKGHLLTSNCGIGYSLLKWWSQRPVGGNLRDQPARRVFCPPFVLQQLTYASWKTRKISLGSVAFSSSLEKDLRFC